MRALALTVVVVSLAGCGLELIGANLGRSDFERPASTLYGTLPFEGTTLVITDADGKELAPFQATVDGGSFELRLPSSKYSNLVLRAQVGNASLPVLVAEAPEETRVRADVDARAVTEALITQARLSADGKTWKQVTPVAYEATRALIRGAFDRPGPTKQLLDMVQRLLDRVIPSLAGEPIYFQAPVLSATYQTLTSALTTQWLALNNGFDFDGDGVPTFDTAQFDQLLADVARLYRPAGCPDPERIRVVFTVDFNDGRLNGNCGTSDRFKWAVDKPGKSMFFVGWVHKDSPVQDTLVTAQLGNGVPNQIPMKDDGTGGDEVAGDNVWTVYFDVPRGVRIGYKYTWGTRGAPWTGSEEWPGNSRIIEAVDVSGAIGPDDIVYRRDVFGDEATNKDRSNLNVSGDGSLDWTDNLRGFGVETRELPVDLNNDCKTSTYKWITPQSVGPLTVACTQ